MKKLLILLLVLIMPIGLLCGCGTKADNYQENLSTRFVIVEKVQESFRDTRDSIYDICIVVDKETKIMYLAFFGRYKVSVETMLNTDGTPMIWQGEL